MIRNTNFYPGAQKRSVDADTAAVQPRKKQRVGGGPSQLQQATAKGTLIHFLCPRTKIQRYSPSMTGSRKGKEVRPSPHPCGENIINSDDELIGAFNEDDEELRSDESEDEVDQDIVVSVL